MTWFKNIVLIDKLSRDGDYDAPVDKNAIFQITDTKVYVRVVTLSKENNIKPLQ